ncbi:crotonase/enoyl-CoA hydratase family protein [Conexibacter sp. SYSU D00693]|uniref:crotonase/enoyl-CoA hydratase family protein n=1 Tax=Conexibacter sp. SYSU D00693 TaxID=2812560 RepID=UPI00196ABB2B|nr:crotonase/enoyl-CoA hydratase family protein [Conexibacter sp. SYSU D00693]
MDGLTSLRYAVDGRVARITLSRPERGNAIDAALPRELRACVEQADLDPAVHVMLLSGEGPGFCGGYDLGLWAQDLGAPDDDPRDRLAPTDPVAIAANHDPRRTWDPTVDLQMMRRNADAFMSLARADKPVVCKAHGFCVAGGTDLALCSDLLIVSDDLKIGYPPARVWGSPTTALWASRIGVQRAARLLFTGDSLTGRQAVEWGLAVESAPADELDERAEDLVQRIARMPRNQLVMMKLLLRQTLTGAGLDATQALGVLLDGITRHTEEGHAFARQAATEGWRTAVRARDEPFGDHGLRPNPPRTPGGA